MFLKFFYNKLASSNIAREAKQVTSKGKIILKKL